MLRRLLFLASSIVFLDTVFFAAIVPLLPTYAADFELTKTGAGVLAAAYPAGTFLGALPGGWLTARIGVRPTVVLGLTTLIASSLAFAFANSIVVLDLARFVQGLGGVLRRLLFLASSIVFLDTVFFAAITPLLPHFEEEFGLSKSGAGTLWPPSIVSMPCAPSIATTVSTDWASIATASSSVFSPLSTSASERSRKNARVRLIAGGSRRANARASSSPHVM